jgi:hypothetical protein
MMDFEQAANFISLSVQPLKTQARTIAGINAKQGRRQRGGRPGHGGGQGRQSHGGRGNLHGHNVGRGCQGQRGGRGISTGYYTPEEWQSLTPDQHTLIMDARSSADSQQQGGANRHQISQVVVDNAALIEDAASALTTPTSLQQPNPAGGNAGNQLCQRSRTIGMIQTGARVTPLSGHTRSASYLSCVSALSHENINNSEGYLGMMELDSHANTCTLGANFCAIAYTEKACNVQLYHPDYQAQSDVPIVQAAMVYTDPDTGESFILVINQGLNMGDSLPASLISPFQLRSNGIIIDDCPKPISPNLSPSSHSIYIPSMDLRTPLQLQGIVSCFLTHFPSDYELNHYPWVELTSDQEWNPNDKRFQELEERMFYDLDSK